MLYMPMQVSRWILKYPMAVFIQTLICLYPPRQCYSPRDMFVAVVCL